MEGLAIHWSERSFSQNMYFYSMITNTHGNFIFWSWKNETKITFSPRTPSQAPWKYCFKLWMSLFGSDTISILVSNYIGHCCVLIFPIISSITQLCATHLSCGPFFNLDLKANSLRTPIRVPNWLKIDFTCMRSIQNLTWNVSLDFLSSNDHDFMHFFFLAIESSDWAYFGQIFARSFQVY